jgi:rSAM/selenodomain-associated transferase 2/rSAM/selenodomain-associated transferase 1
MTEYIVDVSRSVTRKRSASLEIRYTGGTLGEMAQWLGGGISLVEQGPGDLGTRMDASFKSAFKDGIQKAVLIGSDLPGMTEAILSNALEALSLCDVALGPAADGGYYLVGLKAPCPQLFTSVNWGTSTVLDETLEICRDLGFTVEFTDRLADVDRPEDLTHFGLYLSDFTQRVSRESRRGTRPSVSVIMPVLNEEEHILPSLERALEPGGVEVIVADGGSTDGTVDAARSLGVRVLEAPRGRASQMNAGAAEASGEILLFLHADTLLPKGWEALVVAELEKPGTAAAAFQLGLTSRTWGLRIVEALANLRSRVFQMPYGDQAISMKSDLFRRVGGYRELPIMEDWDLIRRLRAHGSIRIAPSSVATSSRRWKAIGVFRATALNQIIIMGYVLGVSPSRLARLYRGSAS